MDGSGTWRGHALIITNPRAGGIGDIALPELVRRCERWVGGAVVRATRARGDAVALARAAASSTVDGAGPAVVVAVGGDGTAREVAHGLATASGPAPGPGRAGPPMFVVPAGTANSWYRTLWGDLPWPEALDAALRQPEPSLRHVDLARLAQNQALVLVGACAGFPPQAIHEAGALTHLTGRARYEAALSALVPRFEPYPGRVLVDGVEVHSGPTLLANVGGGRFRGGQFQLLPDSILDDGLLDVCVIGAEHHPADVLGLTRGAEHVGRPGVVYARGRQVVIERTDARPVWFEHDGEVLVDFGHRFTLEVVPHAVPVLGEPRAARTVPAGTAVGGGHDAA
ncbi:MAG TPA: diacylglycerol kinase family protein [Micromonosporaceae bacterium]|nr:diacylglycerol kinase family protein [Micromonosporaceae bacterium]